MLLHLISLVVNYALGMVVNYALENMSMGERIPIHWVIEELGELKSLNEFCMAHIHVRCCKM